MRDWSPGRDQQVLAFVGHVLGFVTESMSMPLCSMWILARWGPIKMSSLAQESAGDSDVAGDSNSVQG